MTNVLEFPSRDRLGFSADVSHEVLQESAKSYQQGIDAYRAGKARRMPSDKSDCFDRNAWLMGWDDAYQSDKQLA